MHPSQTYECRVHTSAGSVYLMGTSKEGPEQPPWFQRIQNALAIAYVFDLQDYSNGKMGSLCEMQARLNCAVTDLSSLRDDEEPGDLTSFLLILVHSEIFREQVKTTGFRMPPLQITHDFHTAIFGIRDRFLHAVDLPTNILVLPSDEESRRADLIGIFQYIAEERNGVPTTYKNPRSGYKTVISHPILVSK
jgi:hypothetical protein